MHVRGVRGATTITEDLPEEIIGATQELLKIIMELNPSLKSADVASLLLTLTEDLSSAFPAIGVREMGWHGVPLMCMREIHVPDSLPRCIRILVLWNTDLPQNEIIHVYLREAKSLRPDLQEKAK